MNTFASSVLLGGPQFQMMAPAVYDQFVRATNWPFGAALAFILLGVTMTLTLVGSALLGRSGGRRLEGREARRYRGRGTARVE